MLLSDNPQNICQDVWYYEENGGLDFVVWTTDKDGARSVTRFNVPWRKIEKSIERKHGPKQARRK